MRTPAALVRSIARRVSPRHRRWQQLLDSCSLEPTDVAADLEPNDVILCGCPRSGTALLTASLFQPPQMVTVMEPWDGLRYAPPALFRSLRHEIESGSLRRGRLDVSAVRENGRVEWQRDAERSFDVAASANTIVGVKWPAYWQLLGRMPHTKFLVCVRDPAEVVRSFERKGGRLRQGLEYDIAFNRDLNQTLLDQFPDEASRRTGLYDAVGRRVLQHEHDPNVFLVRYERWHTEPDMLLSEISEFLGRDLMNRPTRIESNPKGDFAGAADIRRQSATAHDLGYR